MYNAGAHCSVGRAQYRQAAVMLKFSYLPLKLKICSTAIVSPSLPATPPTSPDEQSLEYPENSRLAMATALSPTGGEGSTALQVKDQVHATHEGASFLERLCLGLTGPDIGLGWVGEHSWCMCTPREGFVEKRKALCSSFNTSLVWRICVRTFLFTQESVIHRMSAIKHLVSQ